MQANRRQVGGEHYGLSDRQHWDLVIEFNWDYFQAQITKYVMRWKTKHDTPAKRKIDLQKAAHFLEKYIENFDSYDELAHPEDYGAKSVGASLSPLQEYLARTHTVEGPGAQTQNKVLTWEELHPVEARRWQNEGYYGDGNCLWRCRVCKQQWRALEPPEHMEPPPDHHPV